MTNVQRKGELIVLDKGRIVHRMTLKKGMTVRINEDISKVRIPEGPQGGVA
jgi:hypothetical protein